MFTSSKSKVIVLTALQEGHCVGAVAKRFGVSRRWVHILLARYRQGGLDALEAKSTAPKSHPHAISDEIRQAIIRLRIELGQAGLDNDSTYHCLASQRSRATCASCLHDLAHPWPSWVSHTPTKEETQGLHPTFPGSATK